MQVLEQPSRQFQRLILLIPLMGQEAEATSRSALWDAGSKNSDCHGIRVGNQPGCYDVVGGSFHAFHVGLGSEIAVQGW